MNQVPRWDLSALFSSIDDPKINELLEKTKIAAKDFRRRYHTKIEENAQPKNILNVIKEYEAIISGATLPQAYGELIFTVDTANSDKGKFLQTVRSMSTEIFSDLLFLELELTALPEEKFQIILKSEELINYRHFFEKLHLWKAHRLSEKEEQILEYKSLTGKQAFTRLFEQELSKQKFALKIEAKIQKLNQSEILNILYTSDDQKNRAAAAKAFTKGLIQKESIYTFVMNTLAEDKKVEDHLRKFDFPEQARHLENETSREAVEAMCKVVEDNYGLVKDYYNFKKEVLGLEKLCDYDRYAPLAKIEKTIDFTEAREIVLDAFGGFNEKFGKIAASFFDNKRIDAKLADGKRGGAYCMGATPEISSYVFMNYAGSINDVMTLAHELGHGVNFELARKQTLLNYNCPLTLAETASIFAETLTFKKLVAEEKDEKILLALYMQKIESIFASVQRQISMFRFEQDFHNVYRQSGELSASQINALWRARQNQMFGNSVELTEGYDNWWMYVSHFIHTPFYVYAYAFGELLAFGFLNQSEKNSEVFASNYEKFLEAGSSKSPQQLADMFNIDLADENFWASGMETIKDYIVKAKQLHASINQE